MGRRVSVLRYEVSVPSDAVAFVSDSMPRSGGLFAASGRRFTARSSDAALVGSTVVTFLVRAAGEVTVSRVLILVRGVLVSVARGLVLVRSGLVVVTARLICVCRRLIAIACLLIGAPV